MSICRYGGVCMGGVQFKQVQLYYMEEQVKLVMGQSLQGQQEEYLIFRNIKLGEGGFGVVKKAISAKEKTRELAVKIVPYGGDPVKREKTEKEINIIRILPDHPNLVRVIPLKCFSDNNFYIFMELCGDGTLSDLVSKPGLPQEGKVLDVFWQLMSGYRVLWQHGIVHQDLKLANVLVKNNTIKITDFGFSILAESYVPTLQRKGTLQYMSLQKLTDAGFIAGQGADVYALGVMMHEIMTKMHPYVNQSGLKNYKDYIIALRNAQLYRPKLVSTFSAPLQGLYEMVIRMVGKSPKQRATCREIYEYLDNDEAFAPFRMREQERTQELMINVPRMNIVEETRTILVPFPVPPEEEQAYINRLKNDKEVRQNEENQRAIQAVQEWALSLRLVVYYFDRLARRLFVEKLRGQMGAERGHAYNRTILACLQAESKLTRWILKELRFPQVFKKEQMALFRGSEEGVRTLRIVRRDEEYIREEINDNLKRTTQHQAKELIGLIQLGEREEFADFKQHVLPFFEDCLRRKAELVSTRPDLVTMAYLIDAASLLKGLPDNNRHLQLEEYFYATETKSKELLFTEVEAQLTNRGIEAAYDSDLYNDDE